MNVITFKNSDQMSKGILISILAHIFVFLIFAVKTYFFPTEDIIFQSAVKVDLVGLPDKFVNPPKLTSETEQEKSEIPESIDKKEPEQKTAKEKEAEVGADKAIKEIAIQNKKEEDAINLEKIKNKEKEAINKLKALSALEKIKDEVGKENKRTKTGGSVKLKGNVLSAGTSLTGLNKLQHDSYVARLDAHIKQNWALPEWLAKKKLQTQIKIKIDEKGNVIFKQIVRSSGNGSYDDIAMDTIDRSSPFPMPPEKFVDILGVDGILIGFPE